MELPTSLTSPADACRLVSLLFGASIAVTFAERLSRARDYDAHGWFPWRIFRFDRTHFAMVRRSPRFFDALFGSVGMAIIAVLAISAVGVMWFSPVASGRFTAAVAVIVAASLLTHVRSTYGGDGSQQMNLVIGVSLLLGFNPWVRPAVGGVALVFIVAQSCLAYFTSGVAKLVSPIWMHGDPLVGIMGTTAYGSPLGYRLVSVDARTRKAICISMVLLETAFPIGLALPHGGLLAFLAWGVAFHISNAVFMGLNTFVWSFVATYPAVVWVWHLLH